MKTYATFNPSDKGGGITLSGGDLTATSTISGWNSVRSTISVSSGKWYWEIRPLAGGTMLGIAKSTASLSTFTGGDANGWAYYLTGDKFTNNSGAAYGASFLTYTETIGIALDLDGGTITFYKNNVSQGTAFTSLTGTMFAGIGLSAVGGAVTANFGATALTYSPPSGFNAGLYTESIINPSRLLMMGVG